MNIISIYISFFKIKRAIQILGIVVGLAMREMFDHIKVYALHRRRSKRQQPLKTYSTPQRIRHTIEELGPTYIKFGQILADRPDVVTNNFRTELKKLQSSARPFDNKLAISLIEKALGESTDEVFIHFNDNAIAAASIGQVYDATLHSGERVVVKIQRPFIENKIKLDIYLMKFLAKRLAKNYPELAAIDIVGLIDEFSESIQKELDYTNESNNLKLFSEMFHDNAKVKIPKVFDQYTTRTLIVMERIDGVTPDSREALLEAGLEPKEVVKNGADTIFQMILQYGVFHADPHPGNLFIGENNVIGIIDFGMVGILRTREIDFIADFTMGFYKKDATMITRSLLSLCKLSYFDEFEELRFDIKQMLLQNMSAKFVDIKNFSAIMQKSIDILVKHRLKVPSGIFLLMKTFVTLEKFSATLDDSVQLSKIVLPYAKEIVKERYSSRRIASECYDTAYSYLKLVRDLPKSLNEIIYKIKEGKIKHEIHIDDDLLFSKTLRAISQRISYVILIVGLFIGSTILIVWDSDRRFGLVILYCSTILILLLLIRWFFNKK